MPPALDPSDIGPLVARSSKCEVFALGESHVVKLYPLGSTAREVQRQIALSRCAHDAGVNAPWVGDSPTRFSVDGRLGAIYERRQGRTITAMLVANPLAVASIGRLLAGEHRRLHDRPPIDGLPPVRGRLVRHLEKDAVLSPERITQLLDIVEQLPDGDQICHGDFCWDNLLVDKDKEEVTVLDWADAGLGHGLSDVARTWVLVNFNHGSESAVSRWICRRLAASYMRAYFVDATTDASIFARWRLVHAALRVRDLDARYHPRILRFVDRELAALT